MVGHRCRPRTARSGVAWPCLAVARSACSFYLDCGRIVGVDKRPQRAPAGSAGIMVQVRGSVRRCVCPWGKSLKRKRRISYRTLLARESFLAPLFHGQPFPSLAPRSDWRSSKACCPDIWPHRGCDLHSYRWCRKGFLRGRVREGILAPASFACASGFSPTDSRRPTPYALRSSPLAPRPPGSNRHLLHAL